MYKQAFVTKEDGLELIRQHLPVLTDQQIEDVLSAIHDRYQLTFQVVPEYKTTTQQFNALSNFNDGRFLQP